MPLQWLYSSDDELVDIFDDSMHKIGTATRYEAHTSGEWHRNFHCWIVSHRSGGAVLFQIRSMKKATFPGMLDSTVGGHYRVNETSRAVVREVQEEIGIKVSFRELTPLGRRIDIATFGGMPKREIAEVFLLIRDLPLAAYRLDRVEVEGLVEIPITNGLKFFSGEVRRIAAKGIKWSHKSGRWIDVAIAVKQRDFVSKVDSYYYTLFIMVQRFLAGEKYLSI